LDVLIIGSQTPEPQSTAAGIRMIQIIKLLKCFKYNIHFACSIPKNDFSANLKDYFVDYYHININDKSFESVLNKIQPNIVLFDRFFTEEQLGWRVDECCPKALKILDTEDLHFLREDREQQLKRLQHNNEKNLLSDKAKRELAAIFRCDLTLMISKFEIDLLTTTYGISEQILFYLPFVYNTGKLSEQMFENYEKRQDFMSIGNFKHKPNLDMVQYLYKNIWSKIRSKLPETEWHIYGAYMPEMIKQLHKPHHGVIVKDRADDALQTIEKYKIMLAPLRFGAGLKGKCLDSMLAGTPSVTTSIGAEGIAEVVDWPGFVENQPDKFADQSIELYKNKSLWETKQKQGLKILNDKFNIENYKEDFKTKILNSLKNLNALRQKNITGQILKHHHQRSTKFMSLWIEEKNKQH